MTSSSAVVPSWIGELGWAVTAPTAKRSESPGRMGATTSPVSAKMIRKRVV